MGRTVAFIPVRGGSKSIPLKNIKDMCGRPLVYWTALAASSAAGIDAVYVATDSDAIRAAIEPYGLPKVQVIGRGAATATDGASTESAMIEFAEQHDDFEHIVLVQATSPLLAADDLDRGLATYAKDGVDGVISVVEDKRFYWREQDGLVTPINYDVFHRPRRQEFPGYLMENGAFYITSRARLLESGNRLSGSIAACVMDPETAYEIDEPSDWVIIEQLLARRLSTQRQSGLAHIKMLLTDCDGCLTDAGMYYGEDGAELKKFNTRDGMGFQLLRESGIKTGIVTSENSEAARRRGTKLKADHIVVGCTNKAEAIRAICAEENIALEEVAYVGDDINDLPALRLVGLPCCPADARPEVVDVARYVSSVKGGAGVIRDVVDYVFSSRV